MVTPIPTPGSWLPKSELTASSSVVEHAKKPFVLRPHLTDKPFKNDPQFSELRELLKKGRRSE